MANQPRKKAAVSAAPKKSTKKATTREQQLESEIASLREMIEQQTAAKAAVQNRLANLNSQHQTPWSELMVGVRNISDMTIGIPGKFGNPAIQLHANFGVDGPGQTTVISYAWWRDLQKSEWVANGRIMRDDSILGSGFVAAPKDEARDLDPGFFVNAIPDPQQWIDDRSEEEIIEAIGKFTSEEPLARLRRLVDEYLSNLENTRPRGTLKEQASAAKWALQRLPHKLHIIDEMATERLEERDVPQEEQEGRKIYLDGRGRPIKDPRGPDSRRR